MDSQIYPTSTEIWPIYTSLHLFYHRNKNQHRNAKWWKGLSMLKRSIFHLLCEIERLEGTDDDESVLPEMRYLHSKVVPKCYMAFSVVVADNQFAPLSLSLVAVLARISHVIKTCRNYALDKLNLEQPKEAALCYGEDRQAASGAIDFEVSTSSTKGLTAANCSRMSAKRNLEQMLEFGDTGCPEQIPQPRRRRRKCNAIDSIFNPLL